MINQIMLVGRLVRTPDLFLTETGKKGSFITLAVGRPFKNQNGEYDTDFIDCALWAGVAESTAEYCKTGDIVGIRGRIQTRIIENEDGSKEKIMEIVADKVTFLSSGSKKKDENEDNNIVSLDEEKMSDEKTNANKNKNDKKK